MSVRLQVQNLGKAYKNYKNKLCKLKTVLLGSKNPANFSYKWILKDVSFSLSSGEALGIIGINGAGKSTLLKLITNTVKASEGQVLRNGRVAALLELGMGFHPDFSGRQNVYMAGQILGLTSQEISQKFDEIVEFSEIGDYIDQPVRVYSSGMQVRLAFSVATAIRPDLLIIDEALSVGDAYFQHKSFERIKKFKKEGTSLLLVSHDKQAIQSICDRAILLSAGRVELDGEPEEVLDYYNAMLSERTGIKEKITTIRSDNEKIITTSGSGQVEILALSLTNDKGNQAEIVKVGEKLNLNVKLTAKANVDDLVVGYLIKDRYGREIFGTNTYHLKSEIKEIQIGEIFGFTFSFDANIGEGNYSISIAAHRGHSHVSGNYLWKDVALVFNVINTDYPSFIGSSWIQPTLKSERR